MRYDLKTPCLNCPFRTDETRIRFSCRERAEEIEESAYRNGFPCHLSAHVDDDDEDAGFEATENSQHCVGYSIMQLKENGGGPWPGMGNNEELAEKLERRVNFKAPVFEDSEAFFVANESEEDRKNA